MSAPISGSFETLGAVCGGLAAGDNLQACKQSVVHSFAYTPKACRFPERKDDYCGGPTGWVAAFGFCHGLPARNTRNENPHPFSNGSTIAVTSSTG